MVESFSYRKRGKPWKHVRMGSRSILTLAVHDYFCFLSSLQSGSDTKHELSYLKDNSCKNICSKIMFKSCFAVAKDNRPKFAQEKFICISKTNDTITLKVYQPGNKIVFLFWKVDTSKIYLYSYFIKNRLLSCMVHWILLPDYIKLLQ